MKFFGLGNARTNILQPRQLERLLDSQMDCTNGQIDGLGSKTDSIDGKIDSIDGKTDSSRNYTDNLDIQATRRTVQTAWTARKLERFFRQLD